MKMSGHKESVGHKRHRADLAKLWAEDRHRAGHTWGEFKGASYYEVKTKQSASNLLFALSCAFQINILVDWTDSPPPPTATNV